VIFYIQGTAGRCAGAGYP